MYIHLNLKETLIVISCLENHLENLKLNRLVNVDKIREVKELACVFHDLRRKIKNEISEIK